MGAWLARLGVKTLYIEPGSPWENGYCAFRAGKEKAALEGAALKQYVKPDRPPVGERL
ncbi:MAG: hypothetical protein Kow00133_05400 [Amphiplicatus sp.]